LFCAGVESGLVLPELCAFGVSFESRDFIQKVRGLNLGQGIDYLN
jgi:hypothetical protein